MAAVRAIPAGNKPDHEALRAVKENLFIALGGRCYRPDPARWETHRHRRI